MSVKVLVVDDSTTIQKVISITLSGSGYELVESKNEADLFSRLEQDVFDLILLDFNLSEGRSGYELVKKVNELSPNSSILVMLGTFDTVDDSKFMFSNRIEKIVKPFESSKFIKKCADLIQKAESVSLDEVSESFQGTSIDDDQVSTEDQVNQWVVDTSSVKTENKIELGLDDSLEDDAGDANVKISRLDPLSSELEGWGMSVPGVIGTDYSRKEFPPVIDEDEAAKLSEGLDLIEESDLEHSPSALEKLKAASTFMDQVEIEADDDLTDPAYEIPQELNSELLKEIDEKKEIEDFWAVDEVDFSPRKTDSSLQQRKVVEEKTEDLTPKVEEFRQSTYQSSLSSIEIPGKEKLAPIDLSNPATLNQLKDMLRPVIQSLVKEYCKQSAEKVAWEVIPDLAENLIRKEIKEIADSVK